MEKLDIDQLYNRLSPRLEILEEERIVLIGKLENLKKISIGVTIVILVGIGYLIGLFWGLLVAAALGITVYTLLYHKTIGAYRKNYKNKVFRELIEELGPNYRYSMDGSLDEDFMRKSGIFHKFNRVKCEDLAEGKFDQYTFKMAEINLWLDSVKNEKHTQRGGAYSYIFKGLFFVGKIPLSFPTPIWILSKDHPKVHPKSRVQESWKKLKVDHSDFRLHYDVYSENKEIAGQILQPGILDIIIEVKENVTDPNMRLELSFQNKNVYISISTIRDLFEPPVKTPVTDKADFTSNFKYLVNTTCLLQQLTLVK